MTVFPWAPGVPGGVPAGPGGPAGARTGFPELVFSVQGAAVYHPAAVPTLQFDLLVDPDGAKIRSLSLNVRVRILAPARGYDETEKARLFELFGAPRDWGRSLRSLLWSETCLAVPPFEGRHTIELRVPCSYDFDVAANKYLHAVRDGSVPLEFQFSGSVFYEDADGDLKTVRLPWDRECRYSMPAGLWHETMERYFPNSAWLRVHRDVFDRLHAFRTNHGLPTWDATLETLLPAEPHPWGGKER